MRIAIDGSARRRRLLQWSVLGLVLLLLGVLLTYLQIRDTRRAFATESDRLRVQADIVTDDIERNLQAINTALDGVVHDHLAASGAEGRVPDIARRLRALVAAMPGVRGMAVYDVHGTMFASHRDDLVGQDFSTRPYFTAVRDKPNARTLYISPPFKSINGDIVTTVGRMVPGPDGKFGGVLLATLDPEYFMSVLRPLVYAPDVWAFLVHGSGVQLLNFPKLAGIDGTDLNYPGSFFRRHLDTLRESSLQSGADGATARQRVVALRTLHPDRLHMDQAFVVGISRETGAIRLPLDRQRNLFMLFFGVVALLGCSSLYWLQSRHARIDALTRERNLEREQAAGRVQLALRGAHLGLFEIQLPSGKWSLDEVACAMVGLPMSELDGNIERWRARMHPQDRAASQQALEDCIAGTAPFYDFSYRIRHHDGRWVWVMARAQAIERDAQGRAVRIMGTIMDISAAKQAEADVLRARNELQTVFDNMGEAVLVFDKQRHLVRMNRAGSTMHGLFEPDVPVERVRSAIEVRTPDGEALPRDQWPNARAMRGDFVRDFEMEVRRTDTGQSIFVESTTAPIAGESGDVELIIHTHRNVTERRDALAMQQARDAADSANRSKAEFLANMSHEIRSPLNVILGLAYLLEKQRLDRDAHDMVQKIRGSGRRLLGIINDVLDVSKIEAGRMELERAPFRLNDVIENVATTMGVAAGGKNIELIVEPAPAGAVAFLGDTLRLEQVLINLTSNAIKFTSVGQVVLSVQVLGRHGEGETLRFSVKDTGIGISPDMQKTVFAAFSQADTSTTRRFGGTGLGLTISRQLVELMGGEIGVVSTPGAGSEFWFSVTLEPYASDGGFSSPEMVTIKALVADDSSIARDAVVATARGLGWHVEAVDSGEAALAQLVAGTAGTLPDVVVLDWKMPGMDGMATARAIRSAAPAADCPIVIMATAYSLSTLADEPGADVVDAVLSKPVTTSALYNSVIEARRRRSASHGGDRIVFTDGASQELGGVRLLVVDDSEINCEVAKRILEDKGATVRVALDGAQALSWLLENPGAVDLVLMDVQMPVMDGIEVTRRLRRLPQFEDLPIVALTAGAFKSQQDEARDAGMTDFVGKPFDVPYTVSLIQRLTRRSKAARSADDAPAQVRALAPQVAPDEGDTDRTVLDAAQGLRTWGNLETYREYLRRFAAAYADAASTIAEDLSVGDRAAAAALAHKLAGVAANVALPAIYRLAWEAERLLSEERDATDVIARLDVALAEAGAAIERFAATSGGVPLSLRSMPVVELPPEIATRVGELLRALMHALDTDSPIPVDPIVAKLSALLPEHQLVPIRDCLRGFDFRGAEEGVRQLSRELGILTRETTDAEPNHIGSGR